MLIGSRDVPSVGDLSPQFSLVNGKLWYNPNVDIRPINQAGTINVNPALGVTAWLDTDQLPDYFCVMLKGFKDEWADMDNIRFFITITYPDSSTANANFTKAEVMGPSPPPLPSGLL
jgi:hypothetical protein